MKISNVIWVIRRVLFTGHVLVVLLIIVLVNILSGDTGSGVSVSRDNIVKTAEEMVPQVESVRGLQFKTKLKIGVQDMNEIRTVIETLMEKEMPDKELEEMHTYMRTMGFLQKDVDLKKILLDLYHEQVAGFYNQHTKELYIVDREVFRNAMSQSNPDSLFNAGSLLPGLSELEKKLVIAHEMTHALQDQYFDIAAMEKKLKENNDQVSAFQAVVEGDAVLAMLHYGFREMGIPLQVADNMGEFMSSFVENMNIPGMETFMRAPYYLKRHFLFAYLDGMRFVQHVHAQQDWNGVNNMYEHLPLSTEQILHPEKYLSRYDPPVRIILPEFHEENYRLVTSTTAGELDIDILLQQYKASTTRDINAAEGWDGDRLEIYSNETDGSSLLRWIIVFDDRTMADKFFLVYADMIPDIYSGLTQVYKSPENKIRWEKNNRIFYLETQSNRIIMLANVPQSLYLKERANMRNVRVETVPGNPPSWRKEDNTVSESASIPMGNMFPVDFSRGILTGSGYRYPEHGLNLEMPSADWDLSVEQAGESLSMLVFSKNNKSVSGNLQIVQFPIPLTVQTLALSFEMGSAMIEETLKAKKISSQTRMINDEYAYEVVMEKNDPQTGSMIRIQQVYLPRFEKCLLLTVIKPSIPSAGLEKDIDYIINSLNKNHELPE